MRRFSPLNREETGFMSHPLRMLLWIRCVLPPPKVTGFESWYLPTIPAAIPEPNGP